MAATERLLNVLTAIAVGCTVVITSLLVVDHVNPKTPPSPQLDRVNRLVANWTDLTAAGHQFGSPSAPLTVVYFADFECPACRSFSRMLEDYRSTHPADIRVVFRHWPLPYHRFAYPSARAAECAANQGRFEAMHRVLFETQDSLGLVQFGELAARAGVADSRAFDACVRDATPVRTIEVDRQMAADLKMRGTPGIIINGTMINDRIPTVQDLQALVAKAKTHGS